MGWREEEWDTMRKKDRMVKRGKRNEKYLVAVRARVMGRRNRNARGKDWRRENNYEVEVKELD